MASYLTMTAAHVNNVFIAAASRIGEERGARYLGCSLIAGTNGWPIGQVASADKQENPVCRHRPDQLAQRAHLEQPERFASRSSSRSLRSDARLHPAPLSAALIRGHD